MKSNVNCLRLAAWLLALFTVILGAKFWVIQVYQTDVPYWDQWKEAKLLFQPWLEGNLTWGALFAPHNEHRIFFTRVLDLFVVWLNRQWDPTLQMTVNAFIHAGYACGLAYCLWIFTGRKKEGLICFLLARFFAFPFAAENTIHGFQSSMYFLSIFSVITMIGLGFGSPGGCGWICGLAAAVMSLFTMGSGFLASLAVVGLVVLRMSKQRRIARDHLITLGCSLAVLAFGLALSVKGEKHELYEASSFPEFFQALAGNLAWPFSDEPVMCCFVCLPLVITGIKYFRSDFKDPRAAEFILALGFWGFLQSAALAYGRVNLGYSSRYMDTLDTIPIASLASLFVLGENMAFRRFSSRAAMMGAIIWVVAVFGGMWQVSRTAMDDYKTVKNYLQWSRLWGLVQEDNVRAFASTDNPSHLLDNPPLMIPYWDANVLLELLRNPKIQAIMPPACRPPLKLERDGKSDGSFVPDGCPPDKPKQEFTQVWGDYPTNAVNAPGSFVSKPLSATLPKLIVSVCCGSNLENISLEFVETSTGRKTELSPKMAGRWHTLIVTAPKNPFRLEITSKGRDSWVAVGEIKEMGRLSCYALALINHAVAVLLLGLFLLACAAGSGALHQKILFSDGSFAEFFILPIALIAIACVWSARNFDATEMSGKLHKTWAVFRASVGDLPGVEMHLREALCLQPDDPETLDTLADFILRDPGLEKNKARQQAVLYYEAALRLKPDYTEARQHLDKTLSELGRRDAAAN